MSSRATATWTYLWVSTPMTTGLPRRFQALRRRLLVNADCRARPGRPPHPRNDRLRRDNHEPVEHLDLAVATLRRLTPDRPPPPRTPRRRKPSPASTGAQTSVMNTVPFSHSSSLAPLPVRGAIIVEPVVHTALRPCISPDASTPPHQPARPGGPLWRQGRGELAVNGGHRRPFAPPGHLHHLWREDQVMPSSTVSAAGSG